MTLTDVVIDLHQRESRAPIAPALAAELRELAAEFGVEAEPRWLLPMFTAVARGEPTRAPVFFEHAPGEPRSYLVELAAVLGWALASDGEATTLELPNLGWRIQLSHEAVSPAGRGGSSYAVSRR